MSLANWAAYLAAVRNPRHRIQFGKTPNASNSAGVEPYSFWLGAPGTGTAPSTAAVPTRATAGCYPFDAQGNAASGGLYIAGTEGINQMYSLGSTVGVTGSSVIMLADRLSHQGGLVGNIATTQTTNLPTAALTRYTSAVGVYAMIETYTAIGTTEFVGTISYTNQAGTSGRTGNWGKYGQEISRCHFVSLQGTDTGVQSVQSVTLGSATATAGNLGVTLFKPLGYVMTNFGEQEQLDPWMSGGFLMDMATPLENDACIMMIGMGYQTTSHYISGAFSMVEY